MKIRFSNSIATDETGAIIDLPLADEIARVNGFMYAEMMSEALDGMEITIAEDLVAFYSVVYAIGTEMVTFEWKDADGACFSNSFKVVARHPDRGFAIDFQGQLIEGPSQGSAQLIRRFTNIGVNIGVHQPPEGV